MKKKSTVFFGLLVCLGCSLGIQAQTIFMKLTPYSGNLTTAMLGPDSSVLDNGKSVKLNDYLQVSSLQYDFVQTLNIGSQSTGIGAGKITFNPLVITKIVDQTSAPLFQNMASGTPFQTIEFIFVQSLDGGLTNSVLYKILLKLAGVKTMALSSVACSTGCLGIAESVSFDYGGYIVTTYIRNAAGKSVIGKVAGWNLVKNVADTDPSVIIK